MAKQNKISYSEAITEITDILSQIEKGELDVDELTEKVRRVTFLIKTCKSKLMSAEKEIETILEKDQKDVL